MKDLKIFRFFLGEFSGEGNSDWGFCNKRSTYSYPFNLSGNFIKLEWELSFPRQEKILLVTLLEALVLSLMIK